MDSVRAGRRMSDSVLYFPYVRVPDSAWFTRMLLYWDHVGTVVPYEFLNAPERLGEHTRSLIEAGLVTQVIPGMYVHRLPRFGVAFLDHLQRSGIVIDRRRRSFDKGEVFGVYAEKIAEVGEELERLRLARRSSDAGNVFEVERQTGFEFMAYLAMVLGQFDDLQFDPVTDDERVLKILAPSSSARGVAKLDSLRLEILEEVLPAPSKPLLAADIREFKVDHGKRLERFRRHVEMELTVLADMTDAGLHNRRLSLFKEQIKVEVEDIRESMRARGWMAIAVGKLSALLAPARSLGPGPELVKVLADAFAGEKPDLRSPLAYAAFAQEKLLGR
jgi:hypothetical protein